MEELEYKEIIVDSENIIFLLEGYECFGWEEDHSLCQYDSFQPYKTILRLKRSCKLVNKMELTRLQRKYEACIKEVDTLEKSKTLKANIYSLGLGMIGMVCFISAWFVLHGQTPAIGLGMLLLIAGILGWIFPIFIYKVVYKRECNKINPFIEKKYVEIVRTCEKGKRLL